MNGKKVVLIVDDAKIDRITLRQILEDSYDVLEAKSGEQALEILETESERVAAVLLDLVMPEMSGFEYMQIHRSSEKLRSIPIIATTVEKNADMERKALELGAADFIAKPYDAGIALLRIKNVIDRSRLQLSRELQYLADYDVLTGIYNKKKFFRVTRNLLDENPDTSFVYLRMDIEKFQLVNTFFGMTEGDRLLHRIADEIKNGAEGNPLVTYGRIEADIFAVCMPFTDKDALIEMVETTKEIFRTYQLEFDIVPTFGFYIVEERNLPIRDMDDRANLAAKKCKGNYIQSYEFYTADMSEEIVREQRIVNCMRRALNEEEFVLYMQPKYGLQTNTITGAEVLVRWQTQEHGMVSPGEFIPIFERNGFIMKLDYYVWEKACQILAKWMKEGRDPYPISVNISRVSLYNPKLVEKICGLAEKYNIPPRLFQLELTESAYTGNPIAIKNMMERLQKAGFTILMDDFGSGYSSLNVLKDIAVDVLKIDMEFLSDTDKKGRSENILASVVRMAKWLNMPVVAEGVERKEQVSFLRSIGCEYVQGYYFSKPVPWEEYEQMVFEQKFPVEETQPLAEENADNLWNSISQMEILFSNMLQAVAIYEYETENENFDIIKVNEAYYNLFGYRDINTSKRGDLYGIDGKERDILFSAFRELVETQEVTECEILRRLESGRTIWIQLKLKYINQIGNKHIIFGTLTDISEQKALDEELQKYRATLNERNKQRTILVVDDLEVNRVSLRCIFEGKYKVLEAENGKQALEVLEKGDVDVILLDLMMPVMDGTTFLEHKNHNPDIADIPVIMITADETTKRQIQTLELGAEDYIVKPIIPQLALRRVEHVLKARI